MERNNIQIDLKQRIKSSSTLSLLNFKTSLKHEFEYNMAQKISNYKMHSKILKMDKILDLDMAQLGYNERRGCINGTGKINSNGNYPYIK